jgi:hypothetical protein
MGLQYRGTSLSRNYPMTKVLGPAEIKQEYVAAMGLKVGELFHDLWDEVASLHMYWAEYVELYARGAERVAMLNRSASSFFWIVEKVLWEHMLIQITRLLDKSKHYEKEQATLKALRDQLDGELKSEAARQLELIRKRAGFCWDWRNRYLAHRDRDLALERAAKPLRLGTMDDVEKILETMADMLNAVREHYGMPRIPFDAPPPIGGVHMLLRTLQLGLMMKDRRNAQIDRGEDPDGGYALPPV